MKNETLNQSKEKNYNNKTRIIIIIVYLDNTMETN